MILCVTMKSIFLLLSYKLVIPIISAYFASAVPVAEQNNEREYSRYVQIPDGEGVMHEVDLEAEPDMELLNEITRDPANNLYLLYTRLVVFFNSYLADLNGCLTKPC